MRKWICFGLAVMICSTTVFGAQRQPEDWIVDGNTKIVKTDAAVNINPYNIATITGVGEGGAFRVVDTYETFDIPLTTPLYRLSENYRDQIIFEDGKWGVKRAVAVKVFDGSEDWILMTRPAYQNDNTTIFSCTNTIPTSVWNGLSTHFDVFIKEEQKINRYDGISFGQNTNEIYMRIMNVRKVTTVEELKTYLKAQYDANTPVKFFFALEKPVFEPFSEEIQDKMNKTDLSKLGFLDGSATKISDLSAAKLDTAFFKNDSTGNVAMDTFLSSIVDLKIYGSSADAVYYIESVMPVVDGFQVIVKDNLSNKYSGILLSSKANYTKDKPVELILKNDTVEKVSIRILFNLSKTAYPENELTDFTAEQTEIQPACIVLDEMVLPSYVAAVEGMNVSLFLQNALLHMEPNSTVTDESLDTILPLANNVLTITDINQTLSTKLKLNDKEQVSNTTVISVPKDAGAGQTRTVLFLGDSLINEDLYTAAFSKHFKEDDIKLNLIGTRGNEDNKHEGRGGWSAYDYCNVESKYGYTNPFLNNGNFDFGYYMTQNKFEKSEKLDSVVINLGVNDLNLVGHNSHDEIIMYFNKIIKSIHDYDSNIKILLNTPTMLHATENTDTAKNQRLSFIKTLNENYADKESENIFLIPTYLSLDPQMNFKQVEPVIDEFNQNHSLVVIDTTHPNKLGYDALANMTYSYFKFIETLGKIEER